MKLKAEKFKTLMQDKGLSVDDLKTITGYSDHVVSWLLDGNPCTYWAIENLSLVIGISPSEITEIERNASGENVIEFIRDGKTATLTLCQGRYISRIRSLAKERPEQCGILAENADGSTIVAHCPSDWIKINPDRILTEEQKEQARVNAIKNLSR